MLWLTLLMGWWQCDLDTETQNDVVRKQWQVCLSAGIRMVNWDGQRKEESRENIFRKEQYVKHQF